MERSAYDMLRGECDKMVPRDDRVDIDEVARAFLKIQKNPQNSRAYDVACRGLRLIDGYDHEPDPAILDAIMGCAALILEAR